MSREGKIVDSAIRKIFETQLSTQLAFYVTENYPNYLLGKVEEIKERLRSLWRFMDADKDHYLATGEFVLEYDKDEIESKVAGLVELYDKADSKKSFEDELRRHDELSCLLLKAAIIKHGSRSSPSKKADALIQFADEVLSGIPARELVVGLKHLTQKSNFFDPANAGLGAPKVPQKINAMAWDLMLIRMIEKINSMDQDGYYHHTFFATFDWRLVELHDDYKIKARLFPPREWKEPSFPIPQENYLEYMGNLVGIERSKAVFNDFATKRRMSQRPSHEQIKVLKSELEKEAIAALSPK
ncbi:MAG TPA: hypothetical protein VF651_06410 [Gammaproteobacteria bacterium]